MLLLKEDQKLEERGSTALVEVWLGGDGVLFASKDT
jgi:hypothetical protein